ncbi:MAG: hypothetical protein HUU47_09095 [Bacteroidetes bacterium]|nr:hypothetical protein [Bacteroidota bacterium]
MKTNKYILIIIFLISASFKPTEIVINGEFKMFTTDNIGNIYAVTHKNDIIKYDKKGIKKAEINLKVLGNVSLIDASNPLEIYVYYQDQGIIKYFDNNLNTLGETNLFKTYDLNNIQVICRSYDNGIWFLDPINLKLRKCDKKGNLLTESVIISNFSDTAISPQMILDDGKFVYLKINSKSLMKFDILANYLNTITLENFSTFQVKDENIFYKSNEGFWVYNTVSFEKTIFNYNFEKTYLNIRTEGNLLYLQDNQSIKVVETTN